MADTSLRVGLSGSESLDSQSDSVTLNYEVHYDSAPTNFYTALAQARAASGDPVPARRSLYSSPSAILVATTFAASIDWKADKRAKLWKWAVTFSPPPQGEGGNGEVSQIENPLERPPVFNIEYQDIEKVLESAKNVEALSHGDGKGANRAANTDGPIVNAAGKRPDEPIVITKRQPVITIAKNFASLDDIDDLNLEFEETTNDGPIGRWGIRQLEFQLAASQGQQFENGIEFWPGVISILAKKTTDLILDNVGYDYWDNVAGDWVRVVDAEGQPVAEPINLKLDGDKGGDNSTTITYRYLEETDYGPLFE